MSEDAHEDDEDLDDNNNNESNNEWLTNPKRIRFIICAFIVFVIMTFVICLQLYSDHYNKWISYTNKPGAKSEGEFLVSPTDINRSFDLVSLSNGLEVLIISDSSADKSAAAIDVGIGSSSDPLSYLGLAHFHEHMLFLGSFTYSKLDSFGSYISMNGGSDNAFTENKHTNFFFSVDNDKFEHSLDIFSHFFIDPLLSKESLKDEIYAVDNEYKKDLPSQAWRDWRMFEFSANKKHSFHKFTVGSIETLQDNKNGDDDVYDVMKMFHNKYVVANIMKCVIYGREDIATLKQWAEDKFSAIVSNKSLKINEARKEGTPYRKNIETSQIYYIETVSKQKQITFFWSLYGFGLEEHYRTPVISFINAHLLQSATNNSLYNILKIKLQLITAMDCDVFYSDAQWSGNAISFELTDKGTKYIDVITRYLYKYLNLLAANTDLFKSYFAESQCIDSLYFDYYSLIKKNPYATVSGLAKRMQVRQAKDLLYLSLNVIPDRLIFNLTQIIAVLQFLANPQNAIIHYTNDEFDTSNFDEMEPFFKIKFHKEAINLSAKLKHNRHKLKYNLEIPPLNPYILDSKNGECSLTKDTKLINDHQGHKEVELILSRASLQIWYKADDRFDSPRININVLFISPLLYDTAINAIYAEIWLQFIDFYSSEWAAFVNTACYSFDLSLNHQGIILSVTGLNKRYLHELIHEFITKYLYIQHKISPHSAQTRSVLRNILISLQKTYKNLNYANVWEQAYFAMYDIVKIPHFDRNLMLDIVNGLLYSTQAPDLLRDLMQYIDDVLSSGFLCEALFHGNIDKKNMMQLVSVVRHSITIKEAKEESNDSFKHNLIKMNHLKLDISGSRKFEYFGFNTNAADGNDVTQVWMQFTSNTNYMETCKVLLLARMMKADCFKQLRTKEKLGYVATALSKSSVGATNNINYLIIMVASAHKSAHYLNGRIQNFIHEHYYHQVLLKLDEDKFNNYVNGTLSDLKQKYLRLSQETSLIWDEIIGHTYFFKWKQEYIRILEEITLNDMIEFYKEYILGTKSKTISIQLYNQKSSKKKKEHIQYSHKVVVTNDDRDKDVLYFNKTKDLQHLHGAQYFKVY